MNFKKFFSELKRRNVYKVAMTYAIVAWLLAQIVALAADTFGAPDWVKKIVFVILIIGFPIALILAWAFEMSPQGMIKTSSSSAKKNPNPTYKKKPLSHKLFIGILLLIIVGQFAYNKYWNNQDIDTSNIKKTIAVLPFINDSPNEDNLYFCNGIMEGILDHLSKIPDLKVVSRTSVEQYRDNKPSLKKIAEELGVQYLVEGSVQRIGNQVVIFAQLINAEDDVHLWSQRYNEDVTELFAVQANVTESIADKLEMIISPSVKERIENIPTNNPLAYDFYLQGNEFRFKANSRTQENEIWIRLLDKAQLSYELALEKDSLFAEAYIGLAFVALERNYNTKIVEGKYLNKVFDLSNKALAINPNLSLGYYARGLYYYYTDNIKYALKDYEKLLELAPNRKEEMDLQLFGYLYYLDFTESIKTIKEMEKSAESEDELLGIYYNYASFYGNIDDHAMQAYYYNKISNIRTEPSTGLWWLYLRTKEFEKAIAYIHNNYPNNNQTRNLLLGASYAHNGEFKKALEYYEKWYDLVKKENFDNDISVRDSHRYGEVLIISGEKEKGLVMVQRQIEINEKLIEMGRDDAGNIYDLVGIYSFLNQKEKAFYWMEKFDQKKGWLKFGGLNSLVRFDYQFDNIRDEPKFIAWVDRGDQQLVTIRKEIRDYLASEEDKVLP